MTKDILIQYCDLQEEIKEIHGRIRKNESELEKINTGGNVTDMVTGGLGGIQHFKIEGFPRTRYDKVKGFLEKNTAILKSREDRLMKILNDIDEFLANIENSRMRRIITYRIIDGMSWEQVGIQLGAGNSSEAVRQEFHRYMDK